MFDGFIVRFVRKDDQPAEEYFYHTYEEAHAHFALFLDDDSDLYERIEIAKDAENGEEILCSSTSWEV